MNIDLIRRFTELKIKIRKLEADAEDLKKEAAQLELQVIEELGMAGMDRLHFDDLEQTVYVSENVYAVTPLGKDAAVELLLSTAGTENDHSGLVETTVNSQRLSKLVRELAAEDSLPAEWAGVLEKGVNFKAGVRRS